MKTQAQSDLTNHHLPHKIDAAQAPSPDLKTYGVIFSLNIIGVVLFLLLRLNLFASFVLLLIVLGYKIKIKSINNKIKNFAFINI
ncbi:MAG: hypothetical protein D6735_06245, partial [Acidobacteria bacterium]